MSICERSGQSREELKHTFCITSINRSLMLQKITVLKLITNFIPVPCTTCNPVWSRMRCVQRDDRTTHCDMYAFSLLNAGRCFFLQDVSPELPDFAIFV